MRFTKTVLMLFAAGLFATSGLAAEKYEIDPSHSNVNFTVRHMAIAKVTGGFKTFSGTIIYDEQDVTKSSVNVTIKVASVNTGDEGRDKHLRSDDFFNAAVDSVITFVSKKIEKRGDSHVAIGDFTLRGVTKEIELPFTILGTIKDQRGNKRLGVEAKTTINRFDYGVKWDRAFEPGNLVVANEVTITLNLEARTPEAPKQ